MTARPIELGYNAADDRFNLWVDGELAARIPFADALALAATICRTASEREADRAKGSPE